MILIIYINKKKTEEEKKRNLLNTHLIKKESTFSPSVHRKNNFSEKNNPPLMRKDYRFLVVFMTSNYLQEECKP